MPSQSNVSAMMRDILSSVDPSLSGIHTAPAKNSAGSEGPQSEFLPCEPKSLEEANLTQIQVDTLILKCLLNVGVATGRAIADQICLPSRLVLEILRRLKFEQVIAYRKAAGPNDYEHELTLAGYESAQRLYEQNPYFGAAPVALDDYRASVAAQSPVNELPTPQQLEKALSDLCIKPEILSQLGQAIYSVGAIFLYGNSGNGKTSIAERLTRTYGKSIWIPRTINVDGEFVRLYDPLVHEAITPDGLGDPENGVDRRWIRIRRPTVVAGGELTLSNLEFSATGPTGTLEAPVHLKSNCGTLVIDDFGRQRLSTNELLNRWIVPLEKRHDYLITSSGKKVQVPFEQLVVFSTNLEPHELVDEAFLRRIPYKIEVKDPTEEEFRDVFQLQCIENQIECDQATITYLIQTHYEKAGRQLRYCHARDLVKQIVTRCKYERLPIGLTKELIDTAVHNYFGTIKGY